MMKRFFLIFLLALAAAACVDMRTASQRPIELRPVADVATKGASGGPFYSTEFPDDRAVLLSAYYTAQERGTGTGPLFSDVTFTKYGFPVASWRGGTASAPNDKYWPIQGSLSFLALTKQTVGATESLGGTVTHPDPAGNNAAWVRYAMPDNSVLQDDILAAYAGPLPCSGHMAIPLVFKHVQALVSVSFACEVNEGNQGVSIKHASLRRASFSGTVDIKAAGADDIAVTWPSLGPAVDAVYFGYSSGLGTRQGTTQSVYGKGLLLPAQHPSGLDGGIDIFIEYTLHNGYQADGVTQDNVAMTYVYTIPDTQWEPMTRYNYAFTFSMQEITCQASASTWNEDPLPTDVLI